MTTQTINSSADIGTLLARPAKDRIQVLDVLRGFALFGILFAHLSNEFSAGMLPQRVYETIMNSPVNMTVTVISNIFVQGKFYTIFSFLFGLSFALQLGSAEQKGGSFLGRYAWRLLVLGIIGTIHHIHWRGDILTIYVVLGFVLLLFRNLPDKPLLILSFLLLLNVPSRLTNLYETLTANPEPDKVLAAEASKQRDAEAEKYYDLIKKGSYVETIKQNFVAFAGKMDFQVMSGRIYMTLGFFLLGLYAGRRRLFENLSTNKPLFKQIFKYTGFGTLALIALACSLFLTPLMKDNPYANVIGGFIFDTGSNALSLFYIAGVTLLFTRTKWANRLSYLAPVGKLALTSYLMQTAFGLLIFQSYGFNLFGEIGIAAATALTFPIFFLQVVFSKWWLARYQYGPVEWVWRSLTYFRLQPLAKPQTTPSSSQVAS
jgi:uncharacterized protein